MPEGNGGSTAAQQHLHAPSQKSLLSSFHIHESVNDIEAQKKATDEGDDSSDRLDSQRREGINNKDLSVLLPVNLTYANLAASGTLRWKSFIFSPVKSFLRTRELREHRSLLTPSSFRGGKSGGIDLPLVGQVKWDDLRQSMMNWLRNPKNLALLVWGIAVGVSGAMLFLIMVGFLDHAIRKKSDRDTWYEINNQILNALFTMMCLYQHPQRLLHLFYLYRWNPDDIKKLRGVYCKDGTYKPHEWSNMLVVVLLLNLNCFGQYALCGLNWGYRRSDRPVVGVGICIAVAIGAPAVAGIYAILSPLGKDYVEDEERHAIREDTEKEQEKTFMQKPSLKIGRAWKLCSKPSFVSRDGSLVTSPEWRGGLFDFKDDPQVTLLSVFCGFCVFGWNMERLGFGNRYVHIVTFLLICTAPYWIFFLAATNIDNTYVRHGLSYGGIVLCVFGLLYGGYWRIQMRKTFGLPEQKWCFGKPGLTDCIQWLFCSLCSLCQEVRTSEAYQIRNNKFYERQGSSIVNGSPQCSPSVKTPGDKGDLPSFSEDELSESKPSYGNILSENGNSKLNLSTSELCTVQISDALDPPIPMEMSSLKTEVHPATQ